MLHAFCRHSHAVRPLHCSCSVRCARQVVVFDQATKLAHCVTWVHLDQHADVESAYRAGRAALRSLTARLSAPQQQLPPGRVSAGTRMMWPPGALGAKYTMTA